MAPKKVDRSARREEILAAAVRVFARKGFAATRIDDVAREADIGKGSVYLYFDSRDALLSAAFEAFAARSRTVLQQTREGTAPPLERLGSLVRSVLSALADDPELARILLDLWSSGREESQLSLDMPSVYSEYRTAIAELLGEAEAEGTVREGPREHYATVIVGAIEGCLLQWLLDPRLPVTELAEPILDVCVEGLRRRKEA
ncbi:AcrR family transcriptional regulator [Lipingzhangella halophila]|uniref:AcrR family transcriptional regulator n=1 Tax=Lipingzhangella halophila TaxID=1783352 RepID=A0A7W7W623_9ACTN|nr:TetR/AcrR family transcriptional regulator [Lipingzhangella halophila]MBB4934469.1 AcrR family transcriptional regulator [Lipingzhangella halophila]